MPLSTVEDPYNLSYFRAKDKYILLCVSRCCIIKIMVNVEIGQNEQKQRLDKFLRKYLENAPLSYIYKAIRKDVKVNGKRCREDYFLQKGDVVTLYIADERLAAFCKKRRIEKVKKQFSIAYEDENILAAVKPLGLLTHGDKTEKKNHLTNQVIDYLIEQGEFQPRLEKTFTPAPVNRLDRNTTGLVLFGKTNPALQALNQLIRQRDGIDKYYQTIVRGSLRENLYLRARMVKDERRNRISVLSEADEGRLMETIVRPLYGDNGYTLVEVRIMTGRTHQIRAQLSSAGYPIIGDQKYGDPETNRRMERYGLHTQLLHAYKLVFGQCGGLLAELSGKVITAELPANFRRIKDEIFAQHE